MYNRIMITNQLRLKNGNTSDTLVEYLLLIKLDSVFMYLEILILNTRMKEIKIALQ